MGTITGLLEEALLGANMGVLGLVTATLCGKLCASVLVYYSVVIGGRCNYRKNSILLRNRVKVIMWRPRLGHFFVNCFSRPVGQSCDI